MYILTDKILFTMSKGVTDPRELSSWLPDFEGLALYFIYLICILITDKGHKVCQVQFLDMEKLLMILGNTKN